MFDTASPISAGPSNSNDSASMGSGTTSADHTVNDSPLDAPDARETTLPIPHDNAPVRHSSNGTMGLSPPRPMATTKRPIDPTTTPATWRGVGRSPRLAAAMTIVKITWACSTSAARPGASPWSIATYRNANWPSDMNAPRVATMCQPTFGRGTKNAAGTATNANRTAANKRGGTSRPSPDMPQWMTTKLKPQMAATAAAISE